MEDKLKRLREEAGLSLREVGRQTGIHFEYVREFENKTKFPSRDQLEGLEKFYGADLREYFRMVRVKMLQKKAWSLWAEAWKVLISDVEDLWR